MRNIKLEAQDATDIQSIRLNSLRAVRHKSFRLTSGSHDSALCRVCASRSTCPMYPISNGETCSSFVPIIVFDDGRNLDAKEVNTVRLGAAWRDRLVAGDKIGLFDKETQELKLAVVTMVSWDHNKERLLAWAARTNHLGMTYDNPPADLKRKLHNCYGKNFYNNAKGLTAIFFQLL